MSYYEKLFESNSQFYHLLRKLRHRELIVSTACYRPHDPWIQSFNDKIKIIYECFSITYYMNDVYLFLLLYMNLPMMVGCQNSSELYILLFNRFHNSFWSYRVYNCCFFSTFIDNLIAVNEKSFLRKFLKSNYIHL